MFEKLEVYQKSLDFSEEVDVLCDAITQKGTYHLIDQLRRASTSIALNIAEGNGRWHKNERKNFFWIARGSTHECVPLLERLKRKQLLVTQNHEKLITELEIINKMLSGLIKGIEQ
ncbi:MAG: four helix bundle protein [Minisyncoccota bacterium]